MNPTYLIVLSYRVLEIIFFAFFVLAVFAFLGVI